jgi:hypothetical protein
MVNNGMIWELPSDNVTVCELEAMAHFVRSFTALKFMAMFQCANFVSLPGRVDQTSAESPSKNRVD